MNKYTIITISETGDQAVRLNETGWMIPMDEDNRHYKQYLQWVAEGNTADEETI